MVMCWCSMLVWLIMVCLICWWCGVICVKLWYCMCRCCRRRVLICMIFWFFCVSRLIDVNIGEVVV